MSDNMSTSLKIKCFKCSPSCSLNRETILPQIPTHAFLSLFSELFLFSELEYDARQAALTQGLNSANAFVNNDLLCKQTKAMAILIVVLLLSGPMTIFL